MVLPGAAAGFASAFLGQEGESGSPEPACLRSGRRGEQAPDRVEHPGISCRDAPGPSVERLLIDGNDPLEPLEARDIPASDRPACPRRRRQDVEDQARLAASGYAGHRGQGAGRNIDVDHPEVVRRGPGDPDAGPGRSGQGRCGGQPARQISPGRRRGDLCDLVRTPFGYDPAAVRTRPRPHVDEPVRRPDDVDVVLDDDDRVPPAGHVLEHGDEARRVPRVKADRRLVQDIGDPGKAGPELGGQPQASGFSSRQGRRPPVHGQIIQAGVAQQGEPPEDLRPDGRCRGRGFYSGAPKTTLVFEEP